MTCTVETCCKETGGQCRYGSTTTTSEALPGRCYTSQGLWFEEDVNTCGSWDQAGLVTAGTNIACLTSTETPTETPITAVPTAVPTATPTKTPTSLAPTALTAETPPGSQYFIEWPHMANWGATDQPCTSRDDIRQMTAEECEQFQASNEWEALSGYFYNPTSGIGASDELNDNEYWGTMPQAWNGPSPFAPGCTAWFDSPQNHVSFFLTGSDTARDTHVRRPHFCLATGEDIPFDAMNSVPHAATPQTIVNSHLRPQAQSSLQAQTGIQVAQVGISLSKISLTA